MCSADIFLGLLAILFPPLPVWVKRGICSADSIINILLLILGYIPGLIHSWYIIAKYPEPGYDYEGGIPQDDERGRVYVFVHDGRSAAHHPQAPRQQQQQQPAKPHGNMSYGATDSADGPSRGPAAGGGAGGEGSSEANNPPPSYAQVVAGDHKVQSQE